MNEDMKKYYWAPKNGLCLRDMETKRQDQTDNPKRLTLAAVARY